MLELKTALDKIEEKIVDYSNRDFYLISCMAILKDFDDEINNWLIHFMNKEKDLSLTLNVSDDEVKEESESKPVSNSKEIDTDKITVGSRDILNKVKKDVPDTVKPIKILVIFRFDENLGKNVWTVNLVEPSLTALSVLLDPENGKILEKKTISLL